MLIVGRFSGPPLVGKLSDFLLRKGNPRSKLITVIHLIIAGLYFCFTQPIPSVYVLGVMAFLSGTMINNYPLVNAVCAETWSIRSAGFNNGVLNMLSSFATAGVLALSGYMAVKFSVAGGPYYNEFQGIWYLGVINAFIGVAGSLYMFYREKKVVVARKSLETHQ